MVFKCLHNMAPESLCNTIIVRDLDRMILTNMYYESAHARRSFSYMAPRLWNNLPDVIRLSTNLIHFKKQTKHLLFNNFNHFMNSVFKYN